MPFIDTWVEWVSHQNYRRVYNFHLELCVSVLAVPVTAQAISNGEAAAMQHAAFPAMQPYPGVGESRVSDCCSNAYNKC